MDNTTHSAIHNLKQLRESFELPKRGYDVVNFGKPEEFIKPTLFIEGKGAAKIKSFEDVIEKWPTDNRKVELIWSHDGSALIVVIAETPTSDHVGIWNCNIQPRFMRDGKVIAQIDIPIDVKFDDIRPPRRLIDHMIFKIINLDPS